MKTTQSEKAVDLGDVGQGTKEQQNKRGLCKKNTPVHRRPCNAQPAHQFHPHLPAYHPAIPVPPNEKLAMFSVLPPLPISYVSCSLFASTVSLSRKTLLSFFRFYLDSDPVLECSYCGYSHPLSKPVYTHTRVSSKQSSSSRAHPPGLQAARAQMP